MGRILIRHGLLRQGPLRHGLLRHGRLGSLALLASLFACLVFSRPSRKFNSVSAATAAPATKPIDNPENIDAAETFDLPALQSKFQAIAKQVAPAVVAISAAETASTSADTQRTDDMSSKKLEDLLDRTTRTVGTGFIFDADGFILTNEHVIEESQQYWVTTDDHKIYPAIVVGADPRADLAVLKIPASRLPTARFSHAATLDRGQWAVTLGNPYGLATEGGMALSVGVISAVDRSLPKLAIKENRLYSNLIQTTAQINPGNSGGPLFDVNGDVIGINTAVILPQKQTNGIGFAIPITPQLLAEISNLRDGREIIYGYVGVTVAPPTPRQRHDAGLNDDAGVRIESVEPNSPAAAPHALREGDIATALNGVALQDTDQFVRLVGAAPIEVVSTIRIVRDGRPMTVSVMPIKRPVQFAVSIENQRLYWRGMVLGPIPANWLARSDHQIAANSNGSTSANNAASATASAKRIAGILVISIDTDSPLKKQGVNTGCVITSVAGRSVTSMLDLQRVINDVPADKCDVRVTDPSSR
jgi:S1-C subfamily serine protease